MGRMKPTLTVDSTLCIGCRMCEAACSLRFTAAVRPIAARLAVLKIDDAGLDLPQICHQCAAPPCSAACPVDALVRDASTGAVVLIPDRCIGCRICITACPFGALGVDPVSGDVIKCDLCGGDPRCVAACPTGALGFESPARPARKRRRKAARRSQAPEPEL
jgi:carbon-monoxide dehydrogenase iron sulfur subunit